MHRWLSLVVVAVLWASPVSADLLYTYTSRPFFFVAGDYVGVVPAIYPASVIDDGADRILGSFVLSDSFIGEVVAGAQSITAGVVSYSFSDGHQTLTELNSTATFGFSWGPSGPVLWDGALTSLGLGWIIDISSTTGTIWSYAPLGGNNLSEAASYNGSAPFCGGAGYEADHGGTNGGTSCVGGVGDIGVNTSQLPSWTWTVQHVPEPATLLLVLSGLTMAVARRWRPWLPCTPPRGHSSDQT